MLLQLGQGRRYTSLISPSEEIIIRKKENLTYMINTDRPILTINITNTSPTFWKKKKLICNFSDSHKRLLTMLSLGTYDATLIPFNFFRNTTVISALVIPLWMAVSVAEVDVNGSE